MKITAISKLLYRTILSIINSIDLLIFRDFCNISKNKHIVYYSGEYHMSSPFNSGGYGRIVQSWSKLFPILNNIEYSIALIIAELIFELSAQCLLKNLNIKPTAKLILTLPKKSNTQLLPLVYISQLLDIRGRDISILDILLMDDDDIRDNKQLMQYKESIGYIMNMSSKYSNSWSLGILRPVGIDGKKMPYSPTNKLAKKLTLIRDKIKRDWDPDDI